MKSISGLIGFICSRILDLQAPVRNTETRKWIKEFMEKVNVAKHVIPILPNLFEWVFERIDETKNDIANSHIELLRPMLNGNGRDYESDKFNKRLEENAISLDNTKSLIADSLPLVAAANANANTRLSNGESLAYRELIATAFVSVLLKKPVRLDTPGYELTPNGLPETLLFDGKRLAKCRDSVDSIVLVATVTVLVRQVLARNRVNVSPSENVELSTQLLVLLKSNTTLADISAHVCRFAEKIYINSRAVRTEAASAIVVALPEEEKNSLLSLVKNAASAENSIFILYSKRIDAFLHAAVLLKETAVDTVLPQLIASSQFATFTETLTDIILNLRLVFDHTVVVHNKHYTAIVKQLLPSQSA
jgi:hypothetical protein